MDEKTSKPMEAVPREEWKGKFCVMRESRTHKNMRFASLHDDALLANEEAERMNTLHPELRFMVVRVVNVVGY
jgi:hypothetical protein